MTSYGPLLDALRGARWPARRAVAAALPGAHRSRQRGTSGEFTEYRVYRQGDDLVLLAKELLPLHDAVSRTPLDPPNAAARSLRQ